MHLVGAGFGVSIVPKALTQIHAEGVVYVPLIGDAPMAWTRLSYRRNDASVAVRNFIATARRHRMVGSVVPRA